VGRPPLDPPRRLSISDAAGAAASIHKLRTRAGDPDLGAFPHPVIDLADVDTAVDYLGRHQKLPPAVLVAELRDRAILIEYQHQRHTGAHERRVLALLNTAHRLKAPPGYGAPLGLGSRQAEYMRRTRLASQYSEEQRAARDDDRARAWLATHGPVLRTVGVALVDHRDTILAAIPDRVHRGEVATGIDTAGAAISSRRPTQAEANAVAATLGLLRNPAILAALPDEVSDPIHQGLRLLW